MTDNHKHLANTYIEIPKVTVAEWYREGQKTSLGLPENVREMFITKFLKVREESWRFIERMKNTQNDNDLNWSDKLIEKDKRIKELEAQVENLKMKVK